MESENRRNFYSSLGEQLRKDGLEELRHQLQTSVNPPPPNRNLPSVFKTFDNDTRKAPPPHLQNFIRPPPRIRKKRKRKKSTFVKSEWETRFVTTHKGCVKCCKFSPDGDLVATGCDDSTLKIMKVETQKAYQQLKREMEFPEEAKPTLKTFFDHSQKISDIVFTKANVIITASEDFTIRMFNQNKKKSFHYFQEIAPIECLAIHPSDQYLLVGSNDRIIRLYNLKSSKCFVQPKDSHDGQVNCLDYSRDGRMFCSGGQDGMIKVWDGRTNQCVRTKRTGNAVFSTSISYNCQYLLSSGVDYKPVIWDLFTMRQIKQFDYNDNSMGTSMNIQNLGSIRKRKNVTKFSNDEKKIMTSINNQILIYDCKKGLEKVLEGHSKYVSCLDNSPTEHVFLTGSDDCRSRLYVRV